jgi:hypothetical protein
MGEKRENELVLGGELKHMNCMLTIFQELDQIDAPPRDGCTTIYDEGEILSRDSRGGIKRFLRIGGFLNNAGRETPSGVRMCFQSHEFEA